MGVGPTYIGGKTGQIEAANVPLTSPTVQDVVDALVALGLVEQSD